jgi:ATP-dependent helicase HrpA
VPQRVKDCLEIAPEFKGSLYEWIGMRLRKLTGEAIPLTEWNPDALSDHLKMNYRVVDEKGRSIAYGRNLKTLQNKYTEEAGDSFDQIAADELNYTGYIKWAFDDLPETYEFIQKGQSFVGFPAIVDEGEAVGVRIFDTREKALQAHYAGLVRLFQLETQKESKYVIKNLPKSHAAELNYNNLAQHPLIKDRAGGRFKEDVLFAILAAVFLEEREIRTQDAFDDSLKNNKNDMVAFANEIGKIVVDIMDKVSTIKKQLNQASTLKEVADDINEQLDYLVYSGFIRHTPYSQLKSIPRYLKAIEYRLDKQKDDKQQMQTLTRYWKRYWAEVEAKSKKQIVIPEQDKFRWDLEELRVSLFAQQLKTAYPVSAKRLDKTWDERF